MKVSPHTFVRVCLGNGVWTKKKDEYMKTKCFAKSEGARVARISSVESLSVMQKQHLAVQHKSIQEW